jgi:hypothetical protein
MRRLQHQHHIGNKAAKAVALGAASIDKIQSSINKCLTNVSSNLLIRDKKADERWATLLQKQEEKMMNEKERVAVKKRKDDFKLLNASAAGMDTWVLVAHNFYKDMILDENATKMAASSAGASTTASASTSTPALQRQRRH